MWRVRRISEESQGQSCRGPWIIFRFLLMLHHCWHFGLQCVLNWVYTSKNIYRWWMKNKLHAKVREKICTLYWRIQTLLLHQALLNNRHKAEQIVQNNKSNRSPLRDCPGTFYPLLYWCPPGVLHQWLITSHICPPVWQQLPLLCMCRMSTIWESDLDLQLLQDTRSHLDPKRQIISGIPHLEAVERSGAA